MIAVSFLSHAGVKRCVAEGWPMVGPKSLLEFAVIRFRVPLRVQPRGHDENEQNACRDFICDCRTDTTAGRCRRGRRQLAPGWSITEIYYHDPVSASGNVALARAAQIGQIPVNLTATVNANVNANVNLGFVAATYVFATPVLGGQASASLLAAYGNNSTSLAGSFMGTFTGPAGGTFPFSQ